jgi:sugar phosphate isomerase/epimerase
MTLMFETGQETGQTLATFLDNLGRDNVAVNFDPANMILYDMGEPIASMKKLMPRIAQCHVKDAVGTKQPGTWGAEMPVGQGEVDWRVFLNVLSAGDFRGDLVIEREGGDNRDADVQTAVDHLTALMN